ERLENFLVTQQGAIKRRQGTRFINEVKDSTKEVRLIPFEFSNEQTYMLEFGDGYIRFYKDGGIILDGGTAYEIFSPYGEADLENIKFIQNKDIMYLVDGEHKIKTLSRYGETNWVLDDFDIYTHPLLDAPKQNSNIIQNGDFVENLSGWYGTGTWTHGGYLNLSNGYYKTQKITFIEPTHQHELRINGFASTVNIKIGTTDGADDILASTNISLNGWSTISVPEPNVEEAYIKLTGPGGTGPWVDDITLRSSENVVKLYSTSGYTSGTEMTLIAVNTGFFSAEYVGSVFKLTDDNDDTNPATIVVEVISYTDENNMQVTPVEDVPTALQNKETSLYQTGAWNGVSGYPSAIAFIEQRLVFGNTTTEPQKLWFSKQTIYDEFNDGTETSDGFNRQLASNQASSIQWIEEVSDAVIVGTSGGIYLLTGGGASDALTPANAMVRKQGNHRSSIITPSNIDGTVLFSQKNRRMIRTLGYSFDVDGYNGDDATIYSDDILGEGIKENAYQEVKSRIIWASLLDGDIATLTYEPAQKIRAWSKQTTDGDFESIATISGSNADEVWVSVKREVDGNIVRYIEMFEPETEDDFLVDSGLSLTDETPFTTVSGLDHLEGKEVSVWNTGLAEDNKTVSSGSITLDNAGTSVVVGLPYESHFRSRRIEAGARNGASQGKPKTTYKVIARLRDTQEGQYSSDGDSWYDIEHRNTVKFTGDVEIILANGYDDKGDIYFKQTKPIPMEIQMLNLMVITNDT
ncbi:MAG: hypothetical protein U9O94_00685, partial [Nanoarchaeota archaeon]|nr:hypothetical protein [Nanoarchaeota archaeon]